MRNGGRRDAMSRTGAHRSAYGGVLSVLLKSIIVLIIVLGIGGFFLWKETQGRPEWYQPPDPRTPEVDRLAQDVEYNTVADLQRIRPVEEETWELALSEQEVNAWLAAGLPGWIEHDASFEWPNDLGVPQVQLDEGRISIAIAIGSGMFERVITTHYDLVLDEDGLWLIPAPVTMGNIDLRDVANRGSTGFSRAIESALDGQRTHELRQWVAFLDGEQPLPPEIELSDGRIVELRRLTVSRGSLRLENRTRVRTAPPAEAGDLASGRDPSGETEAAADATPSEPEG